MIKVWDIETGKPINTIDASPGEYFICFDIYDLYKLIVVNHFQLMHGLCAFPLMVKILRQVVTQAK